MGGPLRETGEGTIKTNTHHTPRVHSDDTDECVRESVRRFFKSLSTRGMLSLMRNGVTVVCFMIDIHEANQDQDKQREDQEPYFFDTRKLLSFPKKLFNK